MEAIGLASNIVQFVDFAATLIATGVELYDSTNGLTQRTNEIESIYSKLNSFSSSLEAATTSCASAEEADALFLPRSSSADRELRSHLKAVHELAGNCRMLCNEIVEAVKKLRVSDRHGRVLGSVAAAIKTAWSSSKISALEDRLDRIRSMILTHCFPLFMYGARTPSSMFPVPGSSQSLIRHALSAANSLISSSLWET